MKINIGWLIEWQNGKAFCGDGNLLSQEIDYVIWGMDNFRIKNYKELNKLTDAALDMSEGQAFSVQVQYMEDDEWKEGANITVTRLRIR